MVARLVGANAHAAAEAVELVARAVIDARGPIAGAFDGRAGYQKFIRLEAAAPRRTGSPAHMLIDARVAQVDGFRFFYVLPLTSDPPADRRHLLLWLRLPGRQHLRERIASTPASEVAGRRRSCAKDRSRHWHAGLTAPGQVHGDDQAADRRPGRPGQRCATTRPTAPTGPTTATGATLVAGYQGGWFHAATGYSFPVALRLALAIAATGAAELPGQAVR
ncbi:MAG: hypothetical protein IPI49_33265 [Myxococcales bacterium]|nr:hypothetical protein [Myxococcales bacterium]